MVDFLVRHVQYAHQHHENNSIYIYIGFDLTPKVLNHDAGL